MGVYDSAHELARIIRESDEAKSYRQLKETAEEDDTNRALLQEFKRLQMQLQIAAMSGQQADADEMQRFSQISSLLYMNSDVQAYLMAEMQMQKMMADIIKIVSEASGLSMDMPGM